MSNNADIWIFAGLGAITGAGVILLFNAARKGAGMLLENKELLPYMGMDPVTSEKMQMAANMYNFLRSKGVSRNHAIGMINNSYHESRLNPGAYTIDSNGKPSGGLFQHNGARFDRLKQFSGGSWKDWRNQILYALSENDTKRYLSRPFSHPADASHWFTVYWERPAGGDASGKKRLRTIYTFINNL